MGAKIKTQKNSVGLPTKPKKFPGPKINLQKSHAEFRSSKNFQKASTVITVWLYIIHRTTWPEHTDTTTNLEIALNTPQKSLLKSSHPK